MKKIKLLLVHKLRKLMNQKARSLSMKVRMPDLYLAPKCAFPHLQVKSLSVARF